MGLYKRIQEVSRAAQTSVLRVGQRYLYLAFESYYTYTQYRDQNARASAETTSKPLRNPVNRLVEFYVTLMWPGPLDESLPIVADDPDRGDKLKEAVYKIFRWSNWELKKNRMVRVFVTSGEMIVKVVSKKNEDDVSERVYFQPIESKHVPVIETDDRGFVTYIRIDIQREERQPDGSTKTFTYTEVWDKEAEFAKRLWKHERDYGSDLSMLGEPVETMTLSDAGVGDFLPFGYAQFRDIGEVRGINAFQAALDKIDEADAVASKLHALVFRGKNPTWALQRSGTDKDGRPLPAPVIPARSTSETTGNGVVEFGGEKFIAVNGEVKCLVPDIQLGDAREVLNDQVEEIEKDLPELQYYKVMRQGDQIATETIRLMLAPAISRLIEARNNAEACLIRATQIALTMAQNIGLQGFEASAIGTYQGRDFDFGFEPREVLPMTPMEKAAQDKAEAEADKARMDIGIPRRIILEERGYDEEEIARMDQLRAKDEQNRTSAAALLMDSAMRQFNSGEAN